MISAQIDELRNAAEFYDGFKAADLMRDAADTIWQLRDDLQRANASVQDAEHDESMAWDRVRKAEAENAKLRELVRDAWGSGHPDKSCGDCEIMDECHAEIEEAHKNGNGRWNTRCLFERRIEDRMRELGVEVEQ